MRIDLTNEKVEMDGKPLHDVVWVDPDKNEACIFSHDRNGHKVPTDTDPTGYETLIVKGAFKVTKSYPVKQENPSLFPGDPWADPFGYPNTCCTQDVDRDGRNGSSIFSNNCQGFTGEVANHYLPFVKNQMAEFRALMVYDTDTMAWSRVRKHQMEPHHMMYWCDERQVWVPRE